MYAIMLLPIIGVWMTISAFFLGIVGRDNIRIGFGTFGVAYVGMLDTIHAT